MDAATLAYVESHEGKVAYWSQEQLIAISADGHECSISHGGRRSEHC